MMSSIVVFVDEIITEMLSIPTLCMAGLEVYKGYVCMTYHVEIKNFRWTLENLVEFMDGHSYGLASTRIRTEDKKFRVKALFKDKEIRGILDELS